MEPNIDVLIESIEISINDMKDISKQKLLVTKHQEILQQINKCKDIIKSYNNVISDDNHSKKINDIDDKSFMDYLNELKIIMESVKNDNDIETLINLYKKANKLVKVCDKYLEKQKMDLINVD